MGMIKEKEKSSCKSEKSDDEENTSCRYFGVGYRRYRGSGAAA
jgi:hypothetical protein